MSYQILPVRHDILAYKFQIELEKTLFNLSFSFSDREDRWALTLSDSANVPIVKNVKLITSWPVFSRFQDNRMPKGELFLLDTAGKNKNAGRDDFGDRILLVYRESTTP